MENVFLNCKYTCSLGDKCCECKNNFYLNLTDDLCYDNTNEGPLVKCALVDYNQSICKFCEEGYYLGADDNKCCKVQNCKFSEKKTNVYNVIHIIA